MTISTLSLSIKTISRVLIQKIIRAVTSEFRFQPWIEQLLCSRRPRDVWTFLGGGFTFVAVVACMDGQPKEYDDGMLRPIFLQTFLTDSGRRGLLGAKARYRAISVHRLETCGILGDDLNRPSGKST